MPADREGPGEPARPQLGPAGTLIRLALVGLILAAVLGTYAFLGGWLTPGALTPARLTDAFEHAAGVHPGFRRNHAKGVGVSGFFESNGNGARFSKAVVFRPGRVPVIGRFSLSGGRSDVADAPHEVRGLGLQFSLPDGEIWRTAMINLPVFPFRTPEAFYENLVASAPDPATGKPDPAGMKALLERQPLRWHLILTIGQPGDPTRDATVAWPPDRERVDVGTLTLDRVEAEETSPARDINFDPLVLPAGIAPSDDPLLSARSAVYSRSFTRREGESKQPSAITAADVRGGK